MIDDSKRRSRLAIRNDLHETKQPVDVDVKSVSRSLIDVIND